MGPVSVYPFLLGLAALCLVGIVIQVWKIKLATEERVYVLVALLVCFVALQGGGAVVGLAATNGTADLSALALAWLICGSVIVELATFGQPVLLPRWLDIFLERKMLLPFGEELERVKKKLRPYSKFFHIWLLLLPPGSSHLNHHRASGLATSPGWT